MIQDDAAGEMEQVYFQGSPALRTCLKRAPRAILILAIAVLLDRFVHPLNWLEALQRRMNNLPQWSEAPFLWLNWGLQHLLWPTALTLVILIFLRPLLRMKSIQYRVTNQRIDSARGIVHRNLDTLELWHVNDLRLQFSLLDRALGVGTIFVYAHDKTFPLLRMEGVLHPQALFALLKERVLAVKRQRGVIKMDMG